MGDVSPSLKLKKNSDLHFPNGESCLVDTMCLFLGVSHSVKTYLKISHSPEVSMFLPLLPTPHIPILKSCGFFWIQI